MTTNGPKRLNKASLVARSQPLLTPTALDAMSDLAREIGLDRNDFAELVMLAGMSDLVATGAEHHDPSVDRTAIEGQIAKTILSRFIAHDTIAVPRTGRSGERVYAEGIAPDHPLAQIFDANVLALKMAHSQALAETVPAPGGYPRDGLGMDLGMPAAKVWEHARGYWRVRPDAEYIVPTRHGYAPFLFKVGDWRTASDDTDPADRTARYWAQSGWLVDAATGKLIGMDGVGDGTATSRDVELGELLSGRVFRYPLGIRNPAVWIGRRPA